ncbi:uncharacterized protein LOC127276739 isoform X1 [Leptopilina boulardi]|uniref:uncharacterized protein LOC127276739 isoform X1 n=1 Tax=Leptopilina boulardi TaxID=63433 RepID=UPI0021F6778E|nr:uncharacterized protein LOC127276739 isoform X1 [Leptopilina boulardi]
MNKKFACLIFVIISIVIFEKKSEACGKCVSRRPNYKKKFYSFFSLENKKNTITLKPFFENLKQFLQDSNGNFVYPIPVFMPVFISQSELPSPIEHECRKRKRKVNSSSKAKRKIKLSSQIPVSNQYYRNR